MAHRTLKDEVRAIRRKYKKITPMRFLFNDASEKRGKFNAIKLWILIHDIDKGYSIFSFILRRKINLSVTEWFKYWKDPHPPYKNSIYGSIVNRVLPAINNRQMSEWTFKSLLGWTRYNAIHKANNTRTGTRNKAAKKRKPNAHNTRRVRH